LRVLIDPSVFRYGRCGLTRYYGALCDGLRDIGIELEIPLVASNCDFQCDLTRRTRWIRRIPKGGLVADMASRFLFRWMVRRGAYDWILATSPQFDASFLQKNPHAQVMMVVHDLMTCVTAPDGLYDAAGPGLAGLLYLAGRASRVICISNDTRDALLRHEVVDPARVTVIHTGNLLANSSTLEKRLTLPSRYFLFVGERSGRKGFFSLIRALQPILRRDPGLHLICTGNLSETERDYIQRHGIAEQVQSMAADDATLITLYRHAIALLYPSLYEGFGLPVIEAMHYGCPVFTTREGALAEVAGDAAVLLDPFDTGAMTTAIEAFLRQPARRERLIELGYAQAAKFECCEMMRAFRNALAPTHE
jgi:glycosyltransferase involved in cell wall biosynthesis